MFEFFISLIAGLFGCAVAGYALHYAFKKSDQLDEFVKHVVKDEEKQDSWDGSWLKFWVIMGIFFYTVIEIAQWIGTHLAGVQY